jgi:hypothetical protein
MKLPILLLLSAALIAPPSAGFAAPNTPNESRYCADSLGRRVACPSREGRSVGQSDEDPDPLLVGGGLLLLGGIAGGVLALTNKSDGGTPFFAPLTTTSPGSTPSPLSP